MLLYGALCTVLSVSFSAIVQIVVFLLQNSNVSRVQASLPPGTEDEIVVIEHLPGRRVHLQDFFWTNAEDAPPWIDLTQGLTFYETKTVHHTVTLYAPVDDTGTQDPRGPAQDPKCTTCIEPTPRLDDADDQNIGVLIAEDPGPRYWLLTVLRSGEAIPSKIELKLARLYRTAFSRQQQRHLGLLQTNLVSQRLAGERSFVRSKPEIAPIQEEMSVNAAVSPVSLTSQINSELQASSLIKSARMTGVSLLENSFSPSSHIDDAGSYNESIYEDELFNSKNSSTIKEETPSSSTDSMFATNAMDVTENSTYYLNQYMQKNASSNLPYETHNQISSENHPISKKQRLNVIKTKGASKYSELRLLDYPAEETVLVRMQNTSVTEGGATRLIYSVHLGGKPVPAETAARDMALLSPQEVALELGAPVLIQSEPYLKESQPLALSRKRDAWLLIGAASAGFIILALILVALIFTAKRKRAHSAVAVPPNRSILKKKQEFVQESGPDNVTFPTSQREIKTEDTDQRDTSGSASRTPGSPESSNSLDIGTQEFLHDDDKEHEKMATQPSSWEYPSQKRTSVHGRISRTNIVDTSRTLESTDVIVDHLDTLDSMETNYAKQEEEATASPHSYLSMPSCKQFPSMKGVEPLSRVLEPVMVKHLDLDSPDLGRRDNNHVNAFRGNEFGEKFFARTSSAIKDPGIVGPIVWNLRKQALSTEVNDTSGTDDPAYVSSSAGPVGRARRRLHDLLEDSFSLFGSRDLKSNMQPSVVRPNSATCTPDVLTIFSETKGRPTHVSPVSSPITELDLRPHTSLSKKHTEQNVEENKTAPAQSRSGWGSRPLSAGPFHRPNLPNIDTKRILVDCQLPPEDPAVPLIASIKKELEKFSP
ncbi:uncharacterized protein LOC143180480 [Calliopsis andreniformis]|uniref:uncharacterized protein LOC143180480 n=1 Tax=Calliopsis andreniformis TaxID=337506 RepID=UPI003FCDFEC8